MGCVQSVRQPGTGARRTQSSAPSTARRSVGRPDETISQRDADLSQIVDRLLATSYARDRVAEALYAVLLDAFTGASCDLPDAIDRDWISGALAVPIQRTTSAALQALVWEMSRALGSAPEGLPERLDRAHRRRQLGRY